MFQSDTGTRQNLSIGLYNVFVLLQICILFPSVILPVKNRNVTTYFLGETILMLAAGYAGLSLTMRRQADMCIVFLVAHLVSCQIQELQSNTYLVRGAGCQLGIPILNVYLLIVAFAVCIYMIIYARVSLTPEIAVALFCGEIVGFVVSVVSSVLSILSVTYENMFY